MTGSDAIKIAKAFNGRCFPLTLVKAAQHTFSIWRRNRLYLCHTINPGFARTADE